MLEIFPKTSAEVPNAHLEFERRKETRMRAFANEFIAEYDSSGLSHLEDVSRIIFGRLGAFLHLALFMACGMVTRDKRQPEATNQLPGGLPRRKVCSSSCILHCWMDTL